MSLEIILKHDPDGEENTFIFGDAKKPEGTLDITANGRYDVTDKATANVQVPQGVFPSGTLDIVENGDYDVTEKENVHVDVPGEVPTGTVDITENGTHDVAGKANANVNVPVGVFPSGTLDVTENGTYDVTQKENVNVNVPGIIPTGDLKITENGHYLVDTYEAATVKVPQGDLRPPIVIKPYIPDVNAIKTCDTCNDMRSIWEMAQPKYPIFIFMCTAKRISREYIAERVNETRPTIEIESVSRENIDLLREMGDTYYPTVGDVPTFLAETGSIVSMTPPESSYSNNNYTFAKAASLYAGDVYIRVKPSTTLSENPQDGLWYIMIWAPNCVDLRIGMTDTKQRSIARVDVIGRTKQTDFSNFLRNMENFQGGTFDLTDATNVTDFLTGTTPYVNGLTIYGYPTVTDNSLWNSSEPEPPPPED